MIKVVLECQFEDCSRNVVVERTFKSECTDLMNGIKQLKPLINDAKKMFVKNVPELINVNVLRLEIV